MLKTETAGRRIQHLLRDLANVNELENNILPLLLHKFNETFIEIWEKYGAIFFHRMAVNERVHIFFKYPSSWSENIKRFKMTAIIRFDLDVSKMTRQGEVVALLL